MNAAALRLRTALEEYVRSISGDTGTRRGGMRAQVNDQDRELVQLSQGLLRRLGGGEGSTGDQADRDTPGARARNRAMTGTGSLESARDTARALLGGAPTNGSAGAPAGGGNEGGSS